MLQYGEDKAIQEAVEAGAQGFIMVDLPPEEAINFRKKCAEAGYVLRLANLCCILTPILSGYPTSR